MLKKYNTCKKLNRLTKCMRYFSVQTRSYEEVKIPVPWGYISGKWWSPQNERPILGIHGWQDNCGTFDTLAPSLAPHVGFLAVDLPGHGWSSQLPPGMFYHFLGYVILVKHIVQHFNWSKVSLLGHSLGGIIAYMYSTLYPTSVDILICLDAFKPIVISSKELKNVSKNIGYFLKLDRLNSAGEPPSYTFQELEQALHTGSWKSVSLEACKYILKRNIAPSKVEHNKFYLTRDPRAKVPSYLVGLPQELVTESAFKLTCPTFISKSSSRDLPFANKLHDEDVLESIRKNNGNVEFHNVEGTHHVHLNNPERLIGLINRFIEKYNIEDRSVGSITPNTATNKKIVV